MTPTEMVVKAAIGGALLLSLESNAQIYQCKDGTGKTTFQQVPCAIGGAMIAAPSRSTPDRRPSQEPHPGAQQLTALIAKYLQERDYQRAESLAVTAEHHQMISEAKRLDAEAETKRLDAEASLLAEKTKLKEAEAKAKASRPRPAPPRGMRCRPDLIGGMNCDSY